MTNRQRWLAINPPNLARWLVRHYGEILRSTQLILQAFAHRYKDLSNIKQEIGYIFFCRFDKL